MKRSTRRTIALAIGVGFLLLVGAAMATAPVGIIQPTLVHARGAVDDRLNVESDSGIKLKTKKPTEFVTQQITIAPGGTTGWHSHPGPVLVTVKSGALRLIYANDRACNGTLYLAGDSFVDRGDETVHIAHNESTGNTELWATYLMPGAPTVPPAPFRLDAADPGPPDSCNPDGDDDDDEGDDDDD